MEFLVFCFLKAPCDLKDIRVHVQSSSVVYAALLCSSSYLVFFFISSPCFFAYVDTTAVPVYIHPDGLSSRGESGCTASPSSIAVVVVA